MTSSLRFRTLAATLGLVLLAACSTAPAPRPATPAAPVATAPNVITVRERYVSVETPADELDSLATWTTDDGRTWVIATGKSSHKLAVYDGDSGERLREVGGEGNGPGQFYRPNGIAVFGDNVFVVERDNHRVQVLSLPDFKVVGTFGEKELRSPYGIWLDEAEPGELSVYVTDSRAGRAVGVCHRQFPVRQEVR
jgi:3-phytase